ncbi:MAG TPA: transcriptional regulator [Bacteroidales bacterium]|nr:transcriptional regulator [Bacteroidales bacterium]
MNAFRELDPLLHSQLRLSIISLLIGVKSAEFTFLLEKTGATRGNVSVQLKKLEEAGYIEISKSFRNNYPLTTCKITRKGVEAFERYVDVLKDYLGKQ